MVVRKGGEMAGRGCLDVPPGVCRGLHNVEGVKGVGYGGDHVCARHV